MRLLRLPAVLRPALVLVLLAPAAVAAQTCPTAGTTVFPGLTGQPLLDSLAANFRPATTLPYDEARDALYAYVDNAAGAVVCRYSGYTAAIPHGAPNARALAAAQDLNTEHTWPQSRGAASAPMHDDLHHLYPTHEGVNSARNNHPYDEIPDAETDMWYRLGTSVSTPLPAFLDEYSERDNAHPLPQYEARFEPREDHKGDAARAMFYFYAMYQAAADAADPAFFPAQRDDLRAWAAADPATAAEHARTCAVQGYQGNVNPFVVDPTLVERAFFSGEQLATVQFTSSAAFAEESGGPVQIAVSILGAHADQPTTVEVALTGGTATNGVDVAAFSPVTLTFPAGVGTPQTFTVTPLDDADDEGNETLVFTLRNPGAGGRVGTPDTFTLTLRDDDGAPAVAWVNEFHYDNAGTDTGEFVEVVLPAGVDPATALVVLYNGSNGAPYDSLDVGTFTPGAVVAGHALYHLTLPANGIQNGPDALALALGGTLVQFLSYEGTFTGAGGPAHGVESVDIGVMQTGTTAAGTAVALTGTGAVYADFAWAVDVAATPGSPNVGQTLTPATDTEGPVEARTAAVRVAPHPVAGRARVEVEVPAAARVRVALFDVLGRRVAVLHDGTAAAGVLRLALDAAALPPGTYVLAVEADALTLRRPVTVVR